MLDSSQEATHTGDYTYRPDDPNGDTVGMDAIARSHTLSTGQGRLMGDAHRMGELLSTAHDAQRAAEYSQLMRDMYPAVPPDWAPSPPRDAKATAIAAMLWPFRVLRDVAIALLITTVAIFVIAGIAVLVIGETALEWMTAVYTEFSDPFR